MLMYATSLGGGHIHTLREQDQFLKKPGANWPASLKALQHLQMQGEGH